jgi:hypothetical protein
MITYSDGYKYQLGVEHQEITPVNGQVIFDDYFRLDQDGTLTVRKGYAWDGASGPTFDTANSLRPSLVHDVFCQIMRDGRLDYPTWRHTVNRHFREQCIANGMSALRAGLWYFAVEFAGAGDPSQGADRRPLQAP